MVYDAVIIGGGLSGLTAGSLLAKRGVKVAVVDKNLDPGGSCGIFKRGHTTFDQGSAMLYGFGENGFNAHRFVFNCLEEPIDVIRHDLLYCVNFKGNKIRFFSDPEKFADELSRVFPSESDNIHRFYRDMLKMYDHVMVETPNYTTPDETDKIAALKSLIRHPVSYIRFISYLNKSAKELLSKYFSDPEVFKFFDKLTSTYCYATVEEAPAVLAAVMFIDNHVGGSFYPAGSTLFLPGKLEKVIEENGGDMYLEKEVTSILFENNKPAGVSLSDGTVLSSENVIYSGTVWNLYKKLIPEKISSRERREWAKKQIPTYPSVVFFSVVDKAAIPEDTAPIEMLADDPNGITEDEITVYILSIDDRTLCGPDEHTVIAIGPSFRDWNTSDKAKYEEMKREEEQRIIRVLDSHFPGYANALRYSELSTPKTIERYTMKNGGAVAGPKQMLGQHMFRRLHTKTEWEGLFCCGESTVMGTGTPTVTTSGLTAANVLLKKLGKEPFVYRKRAKEYVRILNKPFENEMLFESEDEKKRSVMLSAMRCRMCEDPSCTGNAPTDVRGIMRRVCVGNFSGAKKCWQKAPAGKEELKRFEASCVWVKEKQKPVEIRDIIEYIVGEDI